MHGFGENCKLQPCQTKSAPEAKLYFYRKVKLDLDLELDLDFRHYELQQ
jgi:hypothetical protein